MRLLRFGLGPAMWKSCVGSHSRRARVAQASNREIPHLSTMAMGSTATSPSRFCTNDGEYDSTPCRGVLFSKRDAAAPGGPNGGLSTGGWAVAEDLSADRTALRTFVSVAGGTLMRTTSSTSGLAPNTGKRSNMLPVPAPPAAPSKAGLQLKQPSIPHDIRRFRCARCFVAEILLPVELFSTFSDEWKIQNVSITYLYLAFSQVFRIPIKTVFKSIPQSAKKTKKSQEDDYRK